MKYIELTKQDMELQRKLLKAYRKVLKQAPAGRLSAKRIKGKIYYYCVDEATRKEEYLMYTTSFGLKVRSKAELLIAELLYYYNIPFRYDAEVRVKDNFGRYKSRYVDFLFKLPDGSYLIWEHLGLFSKEDYRKEQFEKLTEYFFQGIFMPNNLIITMDGPNGEFDNLAIERMIKGQILPPFSLILPHFSIIFKRKTGKNQRKVEKTACNL